MALSSRPQSDMQHLRNSLREKHVRIGTLAQNEVVLPWLSSKQSMESTAKFLNFWTPEIFAAIYKGTSLHVPKIQTKRQNLKVFSQKDANQIPNSEDPDQTAPLGAV